jgi:transmembrane sensor
MDLNQDEEKSLLARYLDGTCSADEKLEVEQWYLEQASAAGSSAVPANLDSTGKEIWDRIEAGSAVESNLVYKNEGSSGRYAHLLKAASILLLLAAGFIFYSVQLHKARQPVAWIQVSAQTGHIKQLVLPDGSKIWLSAGAVLAYPQSFNKKSREIRLLKGEAFFDIFHDPAKPFIVFTGKLKTQVLGTAFNIKTSRAQQDIRITVMRGKVAVTAKAGHPVFLLPEEQLRYTQKTGNLKKLRVDARALAGWREGRLRFDDEDLASITDALESKFGLKFILADPALLQQRFTMAFNADDDLREILRDLQITGNFHYKQHQNNIIFFPDHEYYKPAN